MEIRMQSNSQLEIGAGVSMVRNKTGSYKSVMKQGLVTVLLIGSVLASAQSIASTKTCERYVQLGTETPSVYAAGVGYNTAFADFGTGCVTLYGATYTIVDWNSPVNGFDFLGGIGWKDLNKMTDAISPTATAWHQHSFSGTTGKGVFTLYGWSPAHEWYIVDDWYGHANNSTIGWGTYVGTITVDGGTYDIRHYLKASTGFNQWWSIRRTPRTSGTVSYPKHFQKWRSLGMPDTNITGLKYLVEANGDAAKGRLTINYIDMTSHSP